MACTSVHQLVQTFGDGSFGACGFELIAKLGDKGSQGFQFGGVGLVVHTIGYGLCLGAFLHLAHALCHCFVCQQHKFLDKLVGIERFLEVAAYGLACLVHVKVQFFSVKLHRSVFKSFLYQFLCQCV